MSTPNLDKTARKMKAVAGRIKVTSCDLCEAYKAEIRKLEAMQASMLAPTDRREYMRNYMREYRSRDPS